MATIHLERPTAIQDEIAMLVADARETDRIVRVDLEADRLAGYYPGDEGAPLQRLMVVEALAATGRGRSRPPLALHDGASRQVAPQPWRTPQPMRDPSHNGPHPRDSPLSSSRPHHTSL